MAIEKGRIGETRLIREIERLGGKIIGNSGFWGRGYDIAFRHRQRIFIAQIKHKEPKRKYRDQGLETRKFRDLLAFQDKWPQLETLLLFTDSSEKIYGGPVKWLDGKGYEHPNSKDNTIEIYWPIDLLKPLETILSGPAFGFQAKL